MPRPLLSDAVLALALAELPRWTRQGETLRREFAFATFSDAMQFMNRVADHAEATRHHPDMDIRYTKVVVSYWSHDAGGITKADIKAAVSVDLIFDEKRGECGFLGPCAP